MVKNTLSKQALAILATLALASLPAAAGEELMPMMPSTWSQPDSGQYSPRPGLQRIASNDPQPRRASEQPPRQDLQKNTVKLKLPSLGATRAASQYRVVEVTETDPEGAIKFDMANSVPTQPQDIPGLLPEVLTIDRYNQPVAAPRDSDLRDLVTFGEDPDWLYGQGYGRLEQRHQPTFRRQPPAQLELPPPLTPSAITDARQRALSPFDDEAPTSAPADRQPDTTVKLTAAPTAAMRVEKSPEPVQPSARPVAVVPEAVPEVEPQIVTESPALRPPTAVDTDVSSLKPPPGFTKTTITPPPAVEKPIPMAEVVALPEFKAPPVAIVQDNTVDIGQYEDVEGFVPIRSLKVF